MTAQHPWPEWLAPPQSTLTRHLDAMGEAHRRLKTAADSGFTYRNIPQAMLNAPMDQMLDVGVMKRRPDGSIGQTVKGHIHLLHAYERAFICNVGAAHRLARQFAATNRLAVVKFLDGVIHGIRVGDLLTPLVCIRSCLEQVAHFHHSHDRLQTALREVPRESGFDAAWQAVNGTREALSKILYGTRIDWAALALADPGQALKKKEIDYRPTANRIDRTVKTILNAVDALDEVVPGLRATYETLCDFAHPNVGTIFILASSCDMLPADGTGIIWIEKKFGLQPPTEFVRSFHAVLERILATLAESLAHYERLLRQANTVADEILGRVQIVVCHLVSQRPDLFDPYAPCPCDTGRKLRFCCGHNAH